MMSGAFGHSTALCLIPNSSTSSSDRDHPRTLFHSCETLCTLQSDGFNEVGYVDLCASMLAGAEASEACHRTDRCPVAVAGVAGSKELVAVVLASCSRHEQAV